jgi:hypothetical protein
MKGQAEARPLYEKWNAFSRIRVYGDPTVPEKPFGWGLSAAYPADRQVNQLHLDIDAAAATILTAFDGTFEDLDYLKYDVTNMVHTIRHDADSLVIGSGGGRDVLAALAFGQKSVVGVELNQDITDTVNRTYGDFTGHLDRHPKVTFVNDEARSYITRSSEQFDIIQVSLIDTWAATAAGAFVLSENSLYTVEAWTLFLEHLTPDGVLTFSRWYFEDNPAEMYRLTSLATTALMQSGITAPRNHIVAIGRIGDQGGSVPDGVGTILVSRQPFSAQDLNTLEAVAADLQFDVLVSPRSAPDATFAAIASGKNLEQLVENFPLDIAAPTDNSPFFFHMLRLRDMFRAGLTNQGVMTMNLVAVYILGTLLVVVVGLTLLCIVVPLMLTAKRTALGGSFPLFLFFSGIGLGFMLVEISQMQRLIVFLGHPTYSLSVVLFALLLSSSLGSYSTQRIGNGRLAGSATVRLLLLLCVLVIFGVATPSAIDAFAGATTPVRIAVAVALLFPLGLFMGMAFPLGMKLASARSESLTPWLWGINGATSVCASVLAVVVAINAGISASFWFGFTCYAVAFVAFLWASRREGVAVAGRLADVRAG